MACEDTPTFVDCDGNELTVTVDGLGNPVVRVCPQNQVVEYAAPAAPPASACQTTADNGTQAFDTGDQCFTHTCRDGAWLPFCGGTSGPVDPTDVSVCYYPNSIGNGVDGWCLGGAGTGWTVGGFNQINTVCDTTTTREINYPATVSVNASYTDASGNIVFDGTPPAEGTVPALVAGAVNTGQASGQTTTISVSGDQNFQPYFGSDRPLIVVDFAMPPGSTGPYRVCFDVVDASGTIGVAGWDSQTDSLMNVPWALAPNGTQLYYPSTAGYGDWVVLDTGTGVTGRHCFQFEGSPQAAPESVDGSNFRLLIMSLGGVDPLPVETLDSFDIRYDSPSFQSDCCDCFTSLSSVAALLNQADPNPVTWTVTDGAVCATMTPALAAQYGNLVFCEGTLPPNQPADPAVFTSSPTGPVCMDEFTGDVTQCATCQGGTVTGFRYRPVGGSVIWTQINV